MLTKFNMNQQNRKNSKQLHFTVSNQNWLESNFNFSRIRAALTWKQVQRLSLIYWTFQCLFIFQGIGPDQKHAFETSHIVTSSICIWARNKLQKQWLHERSSRRKFTKTFCKWTQIFFSSNLLNFVRLLSVFGDSAQHKTSIYHVVSSPSLGT